MPGLWNPRARARIHRVRRGGALLLAAIALGGCATRSHEPSNLYPHKQQVRAYVESGQYLREIAAVAARAKAWLGTRAARGGAGLTVVFDLDETLFFNWPQISATDFGYVPAEWDRWVSNARAPAIEPMLDLYRVARRSGVSVVLITGRTDAERASTESNLRAIGCADYDVLVCKPTGDRRTAAAFKTEARRRIIDEGRTIIANIGDQKSDLVGGFAERVFKLPNPFYISE